MHELGGFGGLVGTIILGPRLGFFDDDEATKNVRKKRMLETQMKNQKKFHKKSKKKISGLSSSFDKNGGLIVGRSCLLK